VTVAVVDSSAYVDLLVGHPRAPRVRTAVEGVDGIAPAHFDAEVLSAISRKVRHGELSARRGGQAIALLPLAAVERIPIEPLLPQAWMLPHNVSAFDSFYVVLARVIGCPLITCDRRLAGEPDLGITVTLVQ
jgi:predicted nucleic acid-binding protein